MARTFFYMVQALLRLSDVVRLHKEPHLDVVDDCGFIEAQTKLDVIQSGERYR